MFHSDIDLHAIAEAHQEELRNERYASASTSTRATPRLVSRLRRNLGLALISAGESIADRRPSRTRPNLEIAPASSGSRFAN
jgi:hypothetical protein